jgi:hypothetical protein
MGYREEDRQRDAEIAREQDERNGRLLAAAAVLRASFGGLWYSRKAAVREARELLREIEREGAHDEE